MTRAFVRAVFWGLAGFALMVIACVGSDDLLSPDCGITECAPEVGP